MDVITFSRSIINNLEFAQSKEWIVTNGIGGYASGTIANLLTRRYHGLLIAALQPPLGRTLLVSKLDETISYANQNIPLFTNRWLGEIIEPHGYQNIEFFHLEGSIPVWTFSISDALLEKRIWMQYGSNTTYVQYHLNRASSPLKLSVKTLVNYHDHHTSTDSEGWNVQVLNVENGIQVNPFIGAVPYRILCTDASVQIKNEWYRNFELLLEKYRGLGSTDDHLFAGEFDVTIEPGQSVTFILSSEDNPNLDGRSAHKERKIYEQKLIDLAPTIPGQLSLAADQFIVDRSTSANPDGKSIIAGYHWFGDWGRDTMISLPGLTLSTGRPEIARSILSTFSEYIDQGMLPNRFPDVGDKPEYNTVDATLWYFEAIQAYYSKTKDLSLIQTLYPKLEDIIACHLKGTRYQIHTDPQDGLLFAGEGGVQLTWMDAKVGDWVVTPRMGKPVEINALWYNALMLMANFAKWLEKDNKIYKTLAKRVKTNFGKFWNDEGGYLFDGIDTPNGVDKTIRPNQLIAASLSYSPLSKEQQKAIVDNAVRYLLTSHGLRSLAPTMQSYIGRYGGDMYHRDGAYHQGTVWGWLIGPFISAHLRVYQNPTLVKSFLLPLINQLSDYGLGSIGEIFDGDAPFTPRGCIAQAWSIAEVNRVMDEITMEEQKIRKSVRIAD
ncbi:MAG: glycogen debranching protein [Chloroflexi bacterium HGW-Chloroflexi-3]|nr:MAG: glycogen debranching protein [Chloroflexi bacterium HGW-Chloroflexi-3]